MSSAAHIGFLDHARLRYLKLALVLCGVAIALYWWHEPADGANGGSWLGYGLGGVGAFLILWLSLLGIRKRRYRKGAGLVMGWVSAHVYLGGSLLVIATLHTGFQFGWNVHTLSYALMLMVLASGLYGVVAYSRYPSLITENRQGRTRQQLLVEVGELNAQALALADAVDPEVHRVIVRSVDRVRIGGGLRAQLFGPRQPDRKDYDALQKGLVERLKSLATSIAGQHDPVPQSTVMFMASRITQAAGRSEQAAARISKLLEILSRRQDLVSRVNRDIQMHARMQVWLLLHVPLTFGLLAALIAHVISVFLYW